MRWGGITQMMRRIAPWLGLAGIMRAAVSRHDVDSGTVRPKKLAGGAVVPPSLQINVETLPEHRARLAREGRWPMTPDEESALFPDEIRRAP